MAQVDFTERQLTLKLVYYGPPLSGKTSNLRALHAAVDKLNRGRLMTLDTRDDRTLFFDLLPIVGLGVGSVMFFVAKGAGKDIVDALSYAKYGVIPWFTWTLLLALMRRQAGEYHPPVGETPLDPARRRRALAMLVVFCLIATPVPFRPVL